MEGRFTMPKDPAYIRNFKKFAQGAPTASDLPRLEAELYGSSDRASAVMLGSIVEAALENFLRSKIRPSLNADDIRLLFEFSGVLGTFGAKIIAAYAFNWYGPETRHDLDLIRTIRNEFAHSRKSFGFLDTPVAEICTNLKSPDWPGSFIPKGSLDLASDDELREAADKTHPRTRFRSACHTISHRLLSQAAGNPRAGDLR
jgi:hypothetical protein